MVTRGIQSVSCALAICLVAGLFGAPVQVVAGAHNLSDSQAQIFVTLLDKSKTPLAGLAVDDISIKEDNLDRRVLTVESRDRSDAGRRGVQR